jgi:ketosteroid isomerase-like protein
MTQNTGAQAEVRKVIDACLDALRAKDSRELVRHQAAGLVHFSLEPPLQVIGGDAKGLEAWFATWRGPIGYEIHDLTIGAGQDIAFCHSLNRMSGTRTDGEKVDLWFRQTLCFRKVGGAWKVAHEHESVPFYMDGSTRAAIDLKP